MSVAKDISSDSSKPNLTSSLIKKESLSHLPVKNSRLRIAQGLKVLCNQGLACLHITFFWWSPVLNLSLAPNADDVSHPHVLIIPSPLILFQFWFLSELTDSSKFNVALSSKTFPNAACFSCLYSITLNINSWHNTNQSPACLSHIYYEFPRADSSVFSKLLNT